MMDPDQREQALKDMQKVSYDFYRAAIQTGNHPFIEFCGFMNEYIKIAEQAHKQGVDFSDATDHNGIALPIETYQAEYIAEKFGCIFGPTFRENPAAWKAFCDRIQNPH